MVRRGEAASGFTLIEFVLALVLVGILAAVVVPRYFDVQSKAEDQIMASVAAEFNAQFEGGFAREILDGKACSEAAKTAVNQALFSMNDIVQSRSISDDVPYRVYPNFLSDGVIAANVADTTITVHLRPSETPHPQKEFSFRLPDCGN